MSEPPAAGSDQPAPESPRTISSAPATDRVGKPAAVTGGGVGALIALYAQRLPDPLKLYVVGLAPVVAAFWTAQWPRVLAWLAVEFRLFRAGWKRWRARRALKKILKDWEAQKQSDSRNMTGTEKSEIESEIGKARKALRDLDKQRLKDLLDWLQTD